MVEWKELKEVFDTRNGYTPSTSNVAFWEGGNIPWFKMEDIRDNGSILNDSYLHITDKAIKGKGLFKANSILLATSATIGEHALIEVEHLSNQRFTNFYPKKKYEQLINMRYAYYYMFIIDEWCRQHVNQGGFASVDMSGLYKQLFPIPSLSEQQRIVERLDTFTSSIENLKQQIAQRRKQYEFYRDQLLDLKGKEGVEMKFITDVAKSFTGLTYKPENVSDSGTLVLRSSNINDDVLSFDDNVFVQMEIPERARVQENDILICVRNGSKRLVGKAAMITKEAEGMAFGAFMTILRSFAINSKFLFYVWQSEKVRRQYKGDEAMPIAQITAKDFQRIVIPVPPLSEQQRIVSILDTFEASIQNLEAQLKEREKQYEYYRNKLLTFE